MSDPTDNRKGFAPVKPEYATQQPVIPNHLLIVVLDIEFMQIPSLPQPLQWRTTVTKTRTFLKKDNSPSHNKRTPMSEA